MNKELREFVIRMAGVIDAVASVAPTADLEYAELEQRSQTYGLLDEQEIERALDNEVEKHLDAVSQEVFLEMQKRKLGEYFLRLQELDVQKGLSFPFPSGRRFSPQVVREAMDPGTREKYGFRVLDDRGGTTAGGILEFAFHMLSYRWMNVYIYKEYFTERPDAVGMDGAFASLVDFDRWLGCPCRSARKDQVRVHSMLSLVSAGYVLPLVSYNPWTDIVDDDSSMKLVETAVKDYGFVGVKIYPPVGYFPAGNAKEPVESTKPRPDLKTLDKKLTTLFSFCLSQNVPVMAHTGESMGRDDASDIFGGPKGWTELLDNFKDQGAPIVNLGHFGGDAPKTFPDGGKSTGSKWPQEFAGLMASRSNARRMYGDIGYWTGLRGCLSSDTCAARQRITEALDAYPRLTQRVMFGTDWLMLSKESDWQQYPEKVIRALSGAIPTDRLMYLNALECFGLSEDGVNRARLAKRLKEATGHLPAWLQSDNRATMRRAGPFANSTDRRELQRMTTLEIDALVKVHPTQA